MNAGKVRDACRLAFRDVDSCRLRHHSCLFIVGYVYSGSQTPQKAAAMPQVLGEECKKFSLQLLLHQGLHLFLLQPTENAPNAS